MAENDAASAKSIRRIADFVGAEPCADLAARARDSPLCRFLCGGKQQARLTGTRRTLSRSVDDPAKGGAAGRLCTGTGNCVERNRREEERQAANRAQRRGTVPAQILDRAGAAAELECRRCT